jgi:hypothetical protein
MHRFVRLAENVMEKIRKEEIMPSWYGVREGRVCEVEEVPGANCVRRFSM